ncbi:hypothetical protein [Actinomadura sp. DC4]|uniref:hypothetical protein n=1 Tax=Actinomadura sp. DC4 TaxID=3055069 RepID=UPI0025B06CA9|nr:hypothetical protein [Actinomadura sp. DC4]MDN3352378.1 hypothetical protein [Actinomadura sp. DC4]
MSARREELIRLSRRLAGRLARQARADQAAFEDAYRLGFEAGVVVGRRQLGEELLAEDRRRAEYVGGVADRASYAELERQRWDGRREDFGRPRPGDFAGLQDPPGEAPGLDAAFFCPRCRRTWSHCTCRS